MALRSRQELRSLIKKTISELFTDEVFINEIAKKFYEKVEQKINKLEEVIKTQQMEIKTLEQKIDGFQQNERANNICIYGIVEESNEKLNTKIPKLISEKTDITCNPDNIVTAYRVGKLNGNLQKPRPIIIKFKCFEDKILVMKNRNKFKGTRIFLSDDLTITRRKLLMDAKSAFGERCAWTFNGRVFIKLNGKNIELHSSDDISQYVEN